MPRDGFKESELKKQSSCTRITMRTRKAGSEKEIDLVSISERNLTKVFKLKIISNEYCRKIVNFATKFSFTEFVKNFVLICLAKHISIKYFLKFKNFSEIKEII